MRPNRAILFCHIPFVLLLCVRSSLSSCHECSCDDCNSTVHRYCHDPIAHESEKTVQRSIGKKLAKFNPPDVTVESEVKCSIRSWDENRNGTWVKVIERSASDVRDIDRCKALRGSLFKNVFCEECRGDDCNSRPIAPISYCYRCECDGCLGGMGNCIVSSEKTPRVAMAVTGEFCAIVTWEYHDGRRYIKRDAVADESDCRKASSSYDYVKCNMCHTNLCNGADFDSIRTLGMKKRDLKAPNKTFRNVSWENALKNTSSSTTKNTRLDVNAKPGDASGKFPGFRKAPPQIGKYFPPKFRSGVVELSQPKVSADGPYYPPPGFGTGIVELLKPTPRNVDARTLHPIPPNFGMQRIAQQPRLDAPPKFGIVGEQARQESRPVPEATWRPEEAYVEQGSSEPVPLGGPPEPAQIERRAEMDPLGFGWQTGPEKQAEPENVMFVESAPEPGKPFECANPERSHEIGKPNLVGPMDPIPERGLGLDLPEPVQPELQSDSMLPDPNQTSLPDGPIDIHQQSTLEPQHLLPGDPFHLADLPRAPIPTNKLPGSVAGLESRKALPKLAGIEQPWQWRLEIQPWLPEVNQPDPLTFRKMPRSTIEFTKPLLDAPRSVSFGTQTETLSASTGQISGEKFECYSCENCPKVNIDTDRTLGVGNCYTEVYKVVAGNGRWVQVVRRGTGSPDGARFMKECLERQKNDPYKTAMCLACREDLCNGGNFIRKEDKLTCYDCYNCFNPSETDEFVESTSGCLVEVGKIKDMFGNWETYVARRTIDDVFRRILEYNLEVCEKRKHDPDHYKDVSCHTCYTDLCNNIVPVG